MNAPLVMTVIGPDRPGLVDSVATLVEEHGGNWLESRMCHLGGQFAGLLRVEIDEVAGESLRRALAELSGQTLEIVAHRSDESKGRECSEIVSVEIVGQDRPGIVKQIARALAEAGANVEELSSECSSAPMSGERLFEANARVCIPESCDSEELRNRLESIAEDLQVDVSFESLEA